MKTLIYLSKTKTDALFGQIPKTERDKLSVELGFNVGFMSGKISSQLPDYSEFSSRCGLIERKLQEEGKVGEVGSSSPWVAETIACRPVLLPQNPNLFLLAGSVGGDSVLLAGSSAHVVSGVPTGEVRTGYSYLPYLAKALQVSLETFDGVSVENPFYSNPALLPNVREHEFADVIHDVFREANGIDMKVDFFGRRLFTGMSLFQVRTQLFSPLYVALNEDV